MTLMKSPSSHRFALLVLALGLVCSASGCSDKKPVVPAKEQAVLARVNDTPISEYDVEQAAKRTLGALSVQSVQRAAHDKLLESAIQSRAIAMAAERELNEDQRFALDKEVAIYREQLLVRHYIDKHAPAAAVTPQIVADYYQKHPDRFGGGTESQYEVVGSSRGVSPQERQGFLTKLRDAASTSDWKQWAAELANGGLPATFSTGAMSDRLLHPKLRELLSGLEAHKPSAIVFVDGRPYVARVVGKSAKAPRPLEDVRADIVRALTSVQLSAAVEKAAAEVMKTAKVDRLKQASPQESPRSPTSNPGPRR